MLSLTRDGGITFFFYIKNKKIPLLYFCYYEMQAVNAFGLHFLHLYNDSKIFTFFVNNSVFIFFSMDYSNIPKLLFLIDNITSYLAAFTTLITILHII